MKFNILAQNLQGEKRTFIYDNEANSLSDENGVEIAYPKEQRVTTDKIAAVFSPENPLIKSENVSVLKIQLGLSCNYTCDYCSQRFVERPLETSKKDIEAFMTKLSALKFNEKNGLKIELWGGEPLVYWKTIKPLVEALNQHFSHWQQKPRFSMITNGSLLTREICHWLYINNFGVAISHDGPGQHVRGPDPLDDPEKKQIILDFYKKMKPHGRISFNAMLNKQNPSRKAIYDFFVALTGDENVVLGEGGLIDAYDDGGMANLLATKDEHFAFRKLAFNDIFSTGGEIGFQGILEKISSFSMSVLNHVPASSVGQKCSMDNPHVLATDLRGNVVTCQNTSVEQVSHNGESHKCGTIDNIKDVRVKTSTHWRNRPNCSGCPVLHICQGSCMYLEGDNWHASCANAYTDAVVIFALAFEKMTGFVPRFIDAEGLPDERKDIWGDMLTHVETPKRKTIPIKVVAEKTSIGDVPVYTASRVESV
jgi:uncharacterized protein